MLCLAYPVVCSHPETLLGNFSFTCYYHQMPLLHFELCCLLEILKINNLNETPGWIGLAWIMLSGYSEPCSWLSNHGCGGCHLRVHLWIASQEQRDL